MRDEHPGSVCDGGHGPRRGVCWCVWCFSEPFRCLPPVRIAPSQRRERAQRVAGTKSALQARCGPFGWQIWAASAGEVMRVSPRLLIASLASCGLAAGHVYITDLVAEDPDESGEDFDESDTLSVLFSEPTSEPFGSSGLAKSDVDALLDFSSEVRGDYWAFWNTSSLLVVHFGVVEAESAPVPGEFQVRCRAAATAAILPRGASSGGCEGSSPPLRGAWGYVRPSLVEISSVVAYDPDDGDEVCACAGGSAGGGLPRPNSLTRTLALARSSARVMCSRSASLLPPTARDETPRRGSSLRRRWRRSWPGRPIPPGPPSLPTGVTTARGSPCG